MCMEIMKFQMNLNVDWGYVDGKGKNPDKRERRLGLRGWKE